MQIAIEEQLQLLSSPVAYSNLVSRLTESGLDLISFENKEKQHHNHNNYNNNNYNINRYKLSGVSVLDCLLEINDEVFPERRIQMGSHLKRILELSHHLDTSNTEIYKKVSEAIGHLARVASISEIGM